MPALKASRLHNLRAYLKLRETPPKQFALMLDMEPTLMFEFASCKREPWLDEAFAISRALGLTGINPLITAGNLSDCDLGIPLPSDNSLLFTGMRLPLSLACRIALNLGVGDPAHLCVTDLHQSIWLMMSSERACVTGKCPWCFEPVGADHLDTCLPNNLWGARDKPTAEHVGIMPRPEMAGKGRRSSDIAYGLRAQREGAHVSRTHLTVMTGISAEQLSRYENLALPLDTERARTIARALRCDPAVIYAMPRDEKGNAVPPVQRGERGYGLKALRLSHEYRPGKPMRQCDMAAIAGLSPDGYAKVERCDGYNLKSDVAARIAARFSVSVASLYAKPGEGEES